MIDIRIEGESMDLFPATRLTLEAANPMLDFNKFPGAKVYAFSLPETPKNQRVLGFYNQPQVGYANRRFYCEKYVNSQLIERGYVYIQDAPAGSYNLYFTQNLGEAFGDLQNTLLTQINFGSMVMPVQPSPDPDWVTASALFPVIENAGFYGNQAIAGFSGKLNNYTASGYDTAGRVPMISWPWLAAMFGQLSGWQFKGSFLQDPDLSRLLFYNLNSLDGAGSLAYQNHLPDLTFPGLLVAFRQLFNLYLDFDVRRKTATAGFVDDILKADVALDWSNKVPPVLVKVPDQQNRLELSYNVDGNDALMKPIPAPFDRYTTPETDRTAGGSVTPIRSSFSTLQTNPATGLAMTNQPGISVNNKDNVNRPTPKLLYWNGMVNGVPTATNSRNGKALTWSGPGNLVDTYWRRFEAFKDRTFMVRQAAILTPADLATFRFSSKVHIRGVNYLVGSYRALLGADDQVIPAELELWKV